MGQLKINFIKFVMFSLFVLIAQYSFSNSVDTSSVKPLKPEYVIILGDGFDHDTVTFAVSSTCIFTKEILTSNSLNGRTHVEFEIYNILGECFVNYDKKVIPVSINKDGFEVTVYLKNRMHKYNILKKNGTFVLILNTSYLNKFEFYQFKNYPELD